MITSVPLPCVREVKGQRSKLPFFCLFICLQLPTIILFPVAAENVLASNMIM